MRRALIVLLVLAGCDHGGGTSSDLDAMSGEVQDVVVADLTAPDSDAVDDPSTIPDSPDIAASVDACVPALVTTTHSYSGDLATVTIGAGFNPLTASVTTRSCLVAPTSTPSCTLRARDFRMQFLQNSNELKSSLRLSAGASFESGFWDAEASARFFRSSEVRSDSAYLLLDVEVTFGAEVLSAPTLSLSSISRLSADPAGFVAACGTEYVSSITRGGIFRAVYIFESLSTWDRNNLAASFSAGGFDWTAMASVQSAIERSTSRYQTQLFVTQSGGALAPVDLTPGALIETARHFGASGVDGGPGAIDCASATPIAVQTSPYYTAEGVPVGARYPDLTAQLNELNNLASAYDRVRVLRNDLGARTARPGRLSSSVCSPDSAQFTALADRIDAYMASAEHKRDACIQINLCGANPQCLITLPTAPTSLPRLLDPAHCGPACTDGALSTYESDEFGYCTRCTWTWPTVVTQDEGRDNLMRSWCRYMRPGARVTYNGTGAIVGDYMFVNIQGTSGPNRGSAVGAAEINLHSPPRWAGFLLGNVDVSASTDSPTEVDVWLDQVRGWQGGTGGLGLRFEGWTIDICDADRSGSCAR
ncbi:MAG: hypothetical protein U0326_10050 [Polyangiales bacterium]